MQITQIRSATVVVGFAGRRFLVDPMLGERGSFPAFAGTPNGELRNPLVDLPMTVERVVDVDAVIVTHLHRDHWDDAAARAIPKDMPMYAQDEADAARLREAGFEDLRILSHDSRFGDVALVKTPGRHGSAETVAALAQRLGQVCGVVFRHPDERTLYLAGDTVWYEGVRDTLVAHRPDVVLLNAGDARIDGHGAIIMGREDVAEVCRAAPAATVVATHMEAVNHALLTRRALREYLGEQGLSERVLIPADGETIEA